MDATESVVVLSAMELPPIFVLKGLERDGTKGRLPKGERG